MVQRPVRKPPQPFPSTLRRSPGWANPHSERHPEVESQLPSLRERAQRRDKTTLPSLAFGFVRWTRVDTAGLPQECKQSHRLVDVDTPWELQDSLACVVCLHLSI